MEFRHTVEVKTEIDFLEKYIDVFCAIGVDSKFWMAHTEKHFYIRCIQLYNKGIDLNSEEAMGYLKESLLHTKNPEQGVYQYRNKLKKKSWLITTNGVLTVPSIFDFRSQTNPEQVNFNLNVVSHADKRT